MMLSQTVDVSVAYMCVVLGKKMKVVMGQHIDEAIMRVWWPL